MELLSGEHLFILTMHVLSSVLVLENAPMEESFKDSDIRYDDTDHDRFKLILAATAEGWWDWKVPENEAYHSPAWYKMLGYEPNEFPASVESWLNLLHPTDRERVWSLQNQYMEKDEAWEITFRMRNKTGNYQWVSSRGRVVARDEKGDATRVVGTHQDISEKVHLKERLKAKREQEELLRGIIKISPATIDIYDILHKRIVYSSGLSPQMLGYSEEEYISLSREFTEKLIHPKDHAVLAEHLQKIMQARDEEIIHCQLRIKKSSGDFIWISLNHGVFRRDANQKPAQLLGSALDITDYKDKEQHLRKVLKILETYSFRNAHELRGPVATILGLVRFMKEEISYPPRAIQLIGYLEQTVQKLDQIIHELNENLDSGF